MKNTVTQGKVPLPLKYTASLSLQVIYFGVLTHYSPVLVIYTPWKQGFLMFSWGIDKQHQAVMG